MPYANISRKIKFKSEKKNEKPFLKINKIKIKNIFLLLSFLFLKQIYLICCFGDLKEKNNLNLLEAYFF